MSKPYHSNGIKSDHMTPPLLFWVLNQRFRLEIDLAATERTAQLHNWLGPGSSIAEDAWEVEWGEFRYFCNPPYGRAGNIRRWLGRGSQVAYHEFISSYGRTSNHIGIWLIPARVGTSWYWESCREWFQWILPGRLQFWSWGRPLPSAAGFPSAIVIMGPGHYLAGVSFWDWREELAGLLRPMLSHKVDLALMEGLDPSQYDRLLWAPAGSGRVLDLIEPWTQEEYKELLKAEENGLGIETIRLRLEEARVQRAQSGP